MAGQFMSLWGQFLGLVAVHGSMEGSSWVGGAVHGSMSAVYWSMGDSSWVYQNSSLVYGGGSFMGLGGSSWVWGDNAIIVFIIGMLSHYFSNIMFVFKN